MGVNLLKRLPWKKRNRMNGEDILIAVVNYTFLTFILVICLVPVLYVVSMSFTSDEAFGTYGTTLIPREWSLAAYEFVLMRSSVILKAYGVSILVTLAGTLGGLMITGGMAYPLSKSNLPGRKVFLIYVMISMLIGGGLIPTYIVITRWLGMRDSILALILPGMLGGSNIVIMKNFFQTLPDSIEESALIDGANQIQVFLRIVLPLSKPIIATLGLFLAVGYWNNWFSASIYINSASKYPIMLVLKNVLSSAAGGSTGVGGGQTIAPSQGVQMAIVIVCLLPIIMVYPFLQKHFAKGMILGSVKG